MISELTAIDFRGFSRLELKQLKRVNLVVGQNNAGKTSLLEGLFLLCQPSRVAELPGLLRAKQGREDLRYFRWLPKDSAVNSTLTCKADTRTINLLLTTSREPLDQAHERWSQVHSTHNLRIAVAQQDVQLRCRSISIQPRDPSLLVSLVGKAQRKRLGEETLQKLLAAVDPRIKKIRVDPGEDGIQIIIDVGLSEMIPISQVGDGVYRLVTILGDIIGENPQVVLIDELENGLHHSVHETVWAGLAETAEQLDVQIFATTHSDELFRAAHRAFLARTNYDFSVVQLFRVESGVQGRVLDKEHIDAAIQGNIDLRS